MQKLFGLAAIAAMTVALPQFALAQSSGQDQSATSIRAQVKDNLADAGFTNIRIMPESFLVRANDKDGNPVMMVINPDSITAVTAESINQSSASEQPQSRSAANSGPAPGQNIDNEKVPGRANGMTAELKQDEQSTLNLTAAQRSTIWSQLGGKATQTASSGFTAAVGEAVPHGMQLQSLPAKLKSEIPSVSSYRYAALSHEVLIVDPTSNKIVAVIKD
jgi:Protein of unknown function (DUF1236)